MKRAVHDLPWLFILFTVLIGCFSTAEAPVKYSAERGVLFSTVRAPLDATWAATRAALDALHLRPYDLQRDTFSALIVGDTADGKEIRVTLKTATASTTEIMIRIVGARERGKVEQIHEAIVERL